MADNPLLSTITLPSGTTYDIKDAKARTDIADIREIIETLEGYTEYLGVTTTALTDGATTNPITIGGVSVTAKKGDIANYQSKEFIFNGTSWQEFGDLSGLGALAYKNSASGSYTPSGSVSQPTFSGTAATITVKGTPAITTADNTNGNYQPKGTVSAPTISVATAGSTTTVKNPTAVSVVTALATAAPGATAPANAVTYYAVDGENLKLYQLGATKGNSITTSNVTVKTGDAAYSASAPTFTGKKAQISAGETTSTGSYTPAGTVTKPTFTGTAGTVTVS